MSFLTLSPDARGFLLLAGSVVLIMFIYNWVRYIQLGKPFGEVCARFCVMIFMLCVQTVLTQHHQGLFIVPVFLPLSALWCLLAVLFAAAVLDQVGIGKWRRSHISTGSVKEAFDDLPSGLLYSLSSGQPVLVNRLMQEISRLAAGEPVFDAEDFWERLRSLKLDGAVRGGNEPIVRLPDGRVYSFRRNSFSVHGGRFYELVASDVTEEYRLTAELEEKQRQARVVNTRLRALIGTIEYVTMSRELLQLKTALHDKIGRSLLYARRYILQPGSVDRKRMLSEWRTHIRQLRNEDPELWQHPYYITEKYAAELGIELFIDGELPRGEELMPVVNMAITVHLTNVLRHAEGKKAMVRIRRRENGFVLVFTNNGKPPDGPIRETGGLKNLRVEVEALGGTMQVQSVPHFRMELFLPEEA